ncbi:MAG TPA: DUF357 domain-containing protein [Candidatus Nanoarchaeia archaeon]|nr:DUF357 domain-containing protein [Candidatus Nanoarchaeia archaeon]
MVHTEITLTKLEHSFSITAEALDKVKQSPKDSERRKEAEDFLDMASRYYQDAKHFQEQGDYVLAYGALHYAHAWLDAGARIGLFKVSDSRLFTVDD